MTNPFETEEEWIEIADETGKKSAMRFLGTVDFVGKHYLLLGAVHQKEDGDDEAGILLVREEMTPDGATEYVLTSDAKEIEQVVGRFIMDEMREAMSESDDEEEELPCGETHGPGEFCFCGKPEYLQ